MLAVGNPFGLGGTVTAGIVSALARNIGGPYDYMQIDAAVNHGNSGGPTFNLEGDVVGVNTAIYSPTGGNVGIAFAVPADTVKRVIEQLEKGGSVSRGWLGVKIQNVDKDMADSLGLKEAKGALISEVLADGPAASAGLKVEDAIVQIDSKKIDDSRDLQRTIADLPAKSDGRRHGLARTRLSRTSRSSSAPIPTKDEAADTETTTKTKKPERPAQRRPEAARPHAEAGTRPPARTASSSPRSIRARTPPTKGLKEGDVILKAGNENVTSPQDVVNAVKKSQDRGPLLQSCSTSRRAAIRRSWWRSRSRRADASTSPAR